MGIVVDLVGGTADDTYGDDDTLKDIENVVGTSMADEIYGDSGPNVIEGNGHDDDKLDGRGGDDTIIVSATFNLGTAQDASGAEPNIKNFEHIKGELAMDATDPLILTGDANSNTITGADAGGSTLGDTLCGLSLIHI